LTAQTLDPKTLEAQARFDDLCNHLRKWFYNPDIEALRIVLAIAASQYYPGDPAWLFIIGPPATGKTSQSIQSVSTAPHVWPIGDLTPQTLLSGKRKQKNDGELSLLQKIGSGTLLIKDFTTLLSKRPEDRMIIVAQLREIYDGLFVKDTGETGRLRWEGKITIIAACTPALERQWAVLRDLGERFMTVRWGRDKGMASGPMSLRQRLHEKEIGIQTAALGKALLADLPPTRPTFPKAYEERLCALAEIVALARGHVVRDGVGDRPIIDVPDAEGTSRIIKSLAAAVEGHAALFHREVTKEDMKLAVRLATDSIPHKRFQVLSCIPLGASISLAHLHNMHKMAATSLEWHLAELVALNLLVEKKSGKGVDDVEFAPEFADIWAIAFPSTT